MSKYEISGYGPRSGERVVRITGSRARAYWFREWLDAAGYLDVEIVRLRRHPGEWRHADAARAFAI